MSSRMMTRVFIPLSLALNVFLVFVVATSLDRGRDGPPPPPPLAMIERMAGHLPPADAAILRKALAAHESAMKESDVALRSVPNRVRAALEATPFDADALRAAFAEGRTARGRMDDVFETVFVEAVSHMSDAGRAALGAWEPPPPPRP